MTSVENPSDTTGSLIAASKVNGTAVYNATGEKLGSIYDVMLEKASGKASYAIMSFGGFLGMGEQYHPLPWAQLTYDGARGGYVVNLDKQQLEGAPAYSADKVNMWDDERAGAINDYYGTLSPTGGVDAAIAGRPGPIMPPR